MTAEHPSPTFPPTIVVVHPKEKRGKCTVEPLRGRRGFAFVTHSDTPTEIPDGYVRLGIGAPPLGHSDHDKGLLVLDATWRLAERMAKDYERIPPRGLPARKTAYPRVSKLQVDPAEGLATIEAIYVAYSMLGRPTDGLLDDYRWADRFLELNRDSPIRSM